MRWCLGFLVLALSGCSAIIDPDRGRLGGQPDAGNRPLDSGTRDAVVPRPDGSSCTEPARCDGDALVVCRAGAITTEDCQARGAFCQIDRCVPWVCMPNQRQCTRDGRNVVVCGSRGDIETLTPCASGCDAATNACVDVPAACMGLPRISVGARAVADLCRESDDHTYVPGEGCPADRRANVGDRVFVLTLERETRLVIELTDVDMMAAIDTVVYVRRACDEMGSQVACDDDVPCETSTVPGGGIGVCIGGQEVRQSRIFATLPAGTYYVVADGFAYRTDSTRYGCGQVELSVQAL